MCDNHTWIKKSHGNRDYTIRYTKCYKCGKIEKYEVKLLDNVVKKNKKDDDDFDLEYKLNWSQGPVYKTSVYHTSLHKQ